MSDNIAYTIVISEEAAAKAEKQAQDAGWTTEMWIAWLVEDYIPADDLAPEEGW